MALFRRQRDDPYAALSDEERMSRYVHLLTTLPVDVIERAHETAFRRVPRRERREMFDRLRPFMSEQEREAGPTPALMAGVLRRMSAQRHGVTALADRGDNKTDTDGDGGPRRDPDPVLPTAAISAMTAQHFLTSAVVVSYFAYGAGAATLDGQPEWVSDLAASDVASAGHAGAYGGEPSAGYGDGGGFGGGFDGGGFGGGFDGGGGFA